MNGSLWARGIWEDNPALVKLLGLCPLLAVSNTTVNALALGLATLVTLLVTNTLVSVLSSQLQYAIRIPIYVLVIATTVSSIELAVKAMLPALHASLGIFLPLVVTNCLIIGRAEAFASKHSWRESAIDAAAMGIGFLWVLVCLGTVRELIGQGSILADATLLFGASAKNWPITVFDNEYAALIAVLPPGAFLALGCLLAIRNSINSAHKNRQGLNDISSDLATFNKSHPGS